MAVQQNAKRTPRHCKPQRRTGNTVVGISAKELTKNCKQGLQKTLDLRAQRGVQQTRGGMRNPKHYFKVFQVFNMFSVIAPECLEPGSQKFKSSVSKIWRCTFTFNATAHLNKFYVYCQVKWWFEGLCKKLKQSFHIKMMFLEKWWRNWLIK